MFEDHPVEVHPILHSVIKILLIESGLENKKSKNPNR